MADAFSQSALWLRQVTPEQLRVKGFTQALNRDVSMVVGFELISLQKVAQCLKPWATTAPASGKKNL